VARFTNEPGFADLRRASMAYRVILSVLGAFLTSFPWVGHMRPSSMVRHADRAFTFSIAAHTAALLALLTGVSRFGRWFEGLAVVIWIFVFWVTFPNF
jgi:hypothetical protein